MKEMRPFLGIFLGDTRVSLGEEFKDWKPRNHYFYEFLNSLVFDFLIPSLLFTLY